MIKQVTMALTSYSPGPGLKISFTSTQWATRQVIISDKFNHSY